MPGRPAPLSRSLLVAATLALACTRAGPPPGGPPRADELELALLFTGDVWGELEPCG